VYELWFKQIIHELDYLWRAPEPRHARALATLKRVLTILKVVVAQIDVLETMTPLEFLSFRERLESGSGFQSLPVPRAGVRARPEEPAGIDRYPRAATRAARLERRHAEPTLWDAFLRYSRPRGTRCRRRCSTRDVTRAIADARRCHPLLIALYQTTRSVSTLCERLVDLDEGSRSGATAT
jgi:tryptophan 2,3-dioxygenase